MPAPIVAAILPFLKPLVSNGLSLVANAVMAKGKDYVEEKTGVKLDQPLGEAELAALKRFEMEHEEELQRLRNESDLIGAELRKAEIQAEVQIAVAAQTTANTEAQSEDSYVRQTRPKLARESFYGGTAYALLTGVVFPFLNEMHGLSLPGVQEWIVLALYAPCLSYFGVRTGDKFAHALSLRK